MAEKLAKWSSKRGLISKIRPSDGCRRDTVPSTVVRGYDLRKSGGHLGNVGQDPFRSLIEPAKVSQITIPITNSNVPEYEVTQAYRRNVG